jgi:hypothetical protein
VRSSRRGWPAARVGRILALLLAVGLFTASLLAPWTSIDVAVSVVSPYNSVITESTSEHLSAMGPAGFLYAGLGALLLLLAAVTVFRAAVPRALVAATAVLAGLTLVDLLVAWLRFRPARDDAVQRMADLVRIANSGQSAGTDVAALQTQTPGISVGVLTVLVVVMLVTATVRPGTGAAVTAATGSLLFVFCLFAPWTTTYWVTRGSVERRHEWWFHLGAATIAVVVGTALLAYLAWWAALRRSTSGRLALLLCSLPLVPALIVAQSNLSLEADDRASAADLAPYVDVDTELRAAFPMNLFAILVLGFSTLLAWRAARRRAHAPASPAGHRAGDAVPEHPEAR